MFSAGIRPACSPELQPAEHLWTLIREPLANRHIEGIDDLDDAFGDRCLILPMVRIESEVSTDGLNSSERPSVEAFNIPWYQALELAPGWRRMECLGAFDPTESSCSVDRVAATGSPSPCPA